MFKDLNLDMVILARCAPGNSWVNPAERMSILNLGLQNCALERHATEDDKFRSHNSMSAIRTAIAAKPELKEPWVSSVQPVQQLIVKRFERLKLKDVPFETIPPVTDDEIGVLQRHLRELFPGMDLQKLQKNNTKKIESYQLWLENHCRQRHYTFQVRKCENPACCPPASLPRERLDWLPDPVLDATSEHYQQYSEVKGQTTTEEDRPTYCKPATGEAGTKSHKKGKMTGNLRSATAAEPVATDSTPTTPGPSTVASMYTAQNARYTVECCECRKPRVIYSKNKLTERQILKLAVSISEADYCCGDHISVQNDNVHVRPGITCREPVKLSYYSSSLGRNDLCCHCGSTDAEVSQELKTKYKTVLPICNECKISGFEAICQRPYGINPK